MAEKEAKQVEKSEAAKREEEILKFWHENKIFEKTEGRGDKEFVFYDGPPFANGSPHYGHILAGTIKDAVPRYKVMKGYKLRRRWGWDCHGLPVENLTEKELGLKGKKEIEEYGIEKFNESTRINIMRDSHIWEAQVPRLGRFVDMKDDYKTMDPTYTESVWWAFKTLFDKGLIYKGFKSMHMCPRCGTTLSNFEVSQGYQDISDISVYVKFALKDQPKTFLLAWTTTPWTLPGNTAIAINEKVDYVSFEKEGETFILSKNSFDKLKTEGATNVQTVKGKDLLGKSYIPPFDYYYKDNSIKNHENGWKVYSADFVTAEDGTGIAHEAPAFGDDDLKLAQKNNIPIIHHVGFDGRFKKEVSDFAGLMVKPKDDKEEDVDHTDTDVEILKYLAKKGALFAKEKITHSYPHCWRCDTPLLNYAADSWFVEVSKFKDKLKEENDKILWVPENVGKYRFGNWLADAHDWAISRSRYWGAPLPVWESEDGKKRHVFGSLEDLKKHTKKSGNTYFVMRHGQYVGNIEQTVNATKSKTKILTEKGRTEVKENTEVYFKAHKKPDIILHSPLERGEETAEIVRGILGLPKDSVHEEKKLIELQFGIYEGYTFTERNRLYPFDEERFEKAPEGAETYTQLYKRTAELLYELEKKYQDKTILLISHGDPAMVLESVTKGWGRRQFLTTLNQSKSFYIGTGEIRELSFAPLPHNRNFELDFHKPYIDEVEIFDDEGKPLKRVPEVFDCWFESGSMPYAQDHYPFEKILFDAEKGRGYPADFIAEGLDQTRGWFYSLIVLGTALFDKAPYKAVIVNGLVLAEDGQKMSKRLQNYPDPMEVVEKYGADALRYYLLSSPVVKGESLSFSERGVDEVVKKHIGRLLNVCTFLETYAAVDKNLDFAALEKTALQSKNVLDQWIIARLSQTTAEIEGGMEKYELDRATRPIALFVDDLSTWYLRRSRDRFKSDNQSDAESALATTRFVLLQFAKAIAPFMPFTADCVFLKLKTKDSQESVHLEKWPELKKADEELVSLMKKAREAVTLGLEARSKVNIKVRQPLKTLTIKNKELEGKEELLALIKDEVNVKEIAFDEGQETGAVLDTSITAELKEEGDVREIIRSIQELRKKENLNPKDRIIVKINTDLRVANAISKYETEIKKAVGADVLQVGSGELSAESGQSPFDISIERSH